MDQKRYRRLTAPATGRLIAPRIPFGALYGNVTLLRNMLHIFLVLVADVFQKFRVGQ